MINRQSAFPLNINAVKEQVRSALAEDVGTGDITAQLLPVQCAAKAIVITREAAIICGRPWVDEVLQQVSPALKIDWRIEEGKQAKSDETLLEISGPGRALLTAERTALNFLQTLSGVATQTAQYLQEIAGTKTQLLDTRKTIPGLRMAEKYAVYCAGGSNHRMGLYDAFLIKENHIRVAGSITKAIHAARALNLHKPLEIEVANLTELEEALAAQAEMILIDNFDLNLCQQAVQITNGRAKLEASGGITLANIKSYAQTGVDFISVGAITKHVRAIDLSMQVILDL